MSDKKYYWLNTDSRRFLERDYLKPGITPEERVREIAETAQRILNIDGFADKFEDYVARGFYSLSTPVWTNFGTSRGCPVSCFNSHIPDTMDGILYSNAEVGMMSKIGGGTSGYFGDVRPRGSTISSDGTQSSGPVLFMEMFDKTSNVVSQGSTRRGSFAAYLPIDHPDADEFLQIRSEGHKIQDMHFAVTITDDWMRKMIGGDKNKRKLWAKVIKKRFETGYPYILFTDNANNNAPQVYIDKRLKINGSNLCSEIMLPSDEENSFVCVLSSYNLANWYELKETDAIETLIYFLDAVNEEFIRKTKDITFMRRAWRFASTHRALGAGALGWHTLLQSKMLSFDSMEAKYLNNEIWKTISSRTNKATVDLASLYGEPELLKGYGRRNTTTLAVAPTTSSSFILGQVSQSIEPYNSNYFTKRLAKGNFTFKNPQLKKLLKEKGQDKEEVWKDILVRGGSVQHLKFLTKEEKDVFKTFDEISQKEIVIQAAQRQKYIDQGISLNLAIPPECPAKDVSDLIIYGWENGIKSFYYQRSANPAQELMRSILTCTSCEG